MVNSKSLANLIPKKKGESSNLNGRPKKGIALVNAELADKGYNPARKQDIEANYMAMIQLTHSELTELAKAPDKPMLVRIIAKNMLDKKGFDIIERMLDRGIGRPTQKEESHVVVKQEMSDKDKKIVSTLIQEIKWA